MNQIRYYKDNINSREKYEVKNGIYIPKHKSTIDSNIDIYNDETGELIYKGLKNKTVIAGAGLIAMKLFDLDRSVLNNTPTYDTTLGLDNGANGSTYPTMVVKDTSGNIIGSVSNECERKICGFCVGQGGAGLDIASRFDVEYDSWIKPDDLVPFRYPLQSTDDVNENIYKGRKAISLSNGQERNAYYFKSISNTPVLEQNYVSTIGSFEDTIGPTTVYNKTTDSKAQSYVELHLKITKEDCRDFFIAHKGLENARINQISLITAWSKTVEITKTNASGNKVTQTIEYLQDIRPFSLLNIPNEILSDLDKSLSIIYTLYF